MDVDMYAGTKCNLAGRSSVFAWLQEIELNQSQEILVQVDELYLYEWRVCVFLWFAWRVC